VYSPSLNGKVPLRGNAVSAGLEKMNAAKLVFFIFVCFCFVFGRVRKRTVLAIMKRDGRLRRFRFRMGKRRLSSGMSRFRYRERRNVKNNLQKLTQKFDGFFYFCFLENVFLFFGAKRK
jgi:hypothetical protein